MDLKSPSNTGSPGELGATSGAWPTAGIAGALVGLLLLLPQCRSGPGLRDPVVIAGSPSTSSAAAVVDPLPPASAAEDVEESTAQEPAPVATDERPAAREPAPRPANAFAGLGKVFFAGNADGWIRVTVDIRDEAAAKAMERGWERRDGKL